MGRPHRIDPTGSWQHIMNRGVDHGAIFFDDIDRVEFGRLLGGARSRFGIEIHAYCLMGNHFHLLVRSVDGQMSRAMHWFGSLFVRFVNDRVARDGPLFKGRYVSRQITDDQYLANAYRYIHLNPVEIVGADRLERYRWSSYRTYLGHRRAPQWLSMAEFQRWIGGPDDIRSFTTAPIVECHPIVRSPNQLVDACEIVVAEQSGSRLRVRSAEVRALALSLVEDADEQAQRSVFDHLELDGGALRTARSRARSLVTADPRAAQMLASARLLTAA